MTHSITRILQAGFALAMVAVPAAALAQADTAAADTATVATAKQQPYGTYLVDSSGKSLYMFVPDKNAEGSTCYDACANVWPPLLTDGKAMASGMAKDKLLGTVERKDGATQVTYDGWPLYYYVGDTEPGDTKGQGVHGYGGGWYLVTPQGRVIHAKGQGSDSSGSNDDDAW